MKKPGRSPWGAIQNSDEITDGIRRVSTASHGGFLLDDVMNAQVTKLFPDFKPSAGPGAYEEDQDWSVVALAFPAFFNDHIFDAVNTARASLRMNAARWRDVVAFLDSPRRAAEYIRNLYDQIVTENAANWTITSIGTSGDAWSVSLRRVGDGACQTVQFTEYPDKRFFTDEDLLLRKCAIT